MTSHFQSPVEAIRGKHVGIAINDNVISLRDSHGAFDIRLPRLNKTLDLSETGIYRYHPRRNYRASRSWSPGSRSLSVNEYHHCLGWLVHLGLGY